MSTFTTTKLTKKQAHALLRTMSQSLNESEARGDDAQKALADAFGAPSGTGTPRDVLTRKLLGRLWRHPNPGTKAIGLRAYYRHEPAGARWGAIATSNKSTRTQPNIEDAWRGLHDLAQRYGIALARVKQGTGQGGAAGAPVELDPGVTELTVIAGPSELNVGQGTFSVERGAARGLAHVGTDKPAPYPHAPMLARALAAHTRAHERRGEDGETLHSDAACALSLRLREPIMGRHVRARSSVPCVQLLVDISGSMRSDNKARHAANAANAILDACRLARVPVQCIDYGAANNGNDLAHLIADWRERTFARENAQHSNTNLPAALGLCLPWIAARAERRKIVLIITDGEVGYDDASRGINASPCSQRSRAGVWPLTPRRQFADAHGIELYAIGLGVDVTHGPETFHGSIRIDKPEELCSTAARELARVIGRGERVAV